MHSLCVVNYCTGQIRDGLVVGFISCVSYHVHLSYIQIGVRWMRPAGPGRSDNCRPMGVFAPPPFPIQVINITSIETVRVTRVSDEAQDVTFSARSVTITYVCCARLVVTV